MARRREGESAPDRSEDVKMTVDRRMPSVGEKWPGSQVQREARRASRLLAVAGHPYILYV